MHNVASSTGRTSCSIRWAFNIRAWNPTEHEWMLAAQCIQEEEKISIEKFVFKKDAKASMAGQLLMRKFIHAATDIPLSEIRTERDSRNKPHFPDNANIDFNVSHQGSYTVLAGEVGVGQKVGVDVMNFERRTGQKLNEYFRLMARTFASEEWDTINSFCMDKDKIAMFYRHWCLKESYVKAIGVGITLDLRRIRFHINTRGLSKTKACVDTVVFVDNKQNFNWKFEEWLLDDDHCVVVARSGNNDNSTPVPFQILDWTQLFQGFTPIIQPDLKAAQNFIIKDECP